jgi:2-C-methyl-D-erythritol 4-phosphate cytidylyltransferase
MTVALLTAAGTGSRMRCEIPKQFLPVKNKPILLYTMEAFQMHPGIDAILVVGLVGWHDILWAYAREYGITKLKWIVDGGATGQESIKNGLMELKKHISQEDIVLIHDGNRPMVSQAIISDSLTRQQIDGDAVAVIPCVEVVFRSTDGVTSDDCVPREQLYRTQTPHCYKFEKLLWAHEQADRLGIANTGASCSLMQALGETIHFSIGSEKNLKITTGEDLEIFSALLESGQK